MNNLKKILSLALACMMLLSLLAGCGGQTSGGNEPSDSTGGEQSKGGSSTQGSEITLLRQSSRHLHRAVRSPSE